MQRKVLNMQLSGLFEIERSSFAACLHNARHPRKHTHHTTAAHSSHSTRAACKGAQTPQRTGDARAALGPTRPMTSVRDTRARLEGARGSEPPRVLSEPSRSPPSDESEFCSAQRQAH